MAFAIACLAAAVFGCFSLYGWWFYVSVGTAHGPGAELGLMAGIAAIGAAGIAGWLKWRERHG